MTTKTRPALTAGPAIRRALEERGVNASDLARMINRPRPSVGRTMAAPILPPSGILADIAAALDLVPELVPAGDGETYRVSMDDAQHRAAFGAMTPAQRGQLIAAALSLRSTLTPDDDPQP